MRYLLDTAVFLWAALDQTDELSHQVMEILTKEPRSIFLSAASSWEIAIKYSLGKLKLKVRPSEMVEELTFDRNLQHLPITYRHALKTASLPWHHKDPFDRLLIAQAIVEDLPILTPDEQFKQYGVTIVW